MIKIFVGGFPLEMKEIELVQLISIYGEVSTIKIVRDKKTGVCKGYAFLEMASLEDAENAILALNGAPMRKRELVLNIVEEPEPQRSAKARVPGKQKSGDVKVGLKTETVKKKRPRITG